MKTLISLLILFFSYPVVLQNKDTNELPFIQDGGTIAKQEEQIKTYSFPEEFTFDEWNFDYTGIGIWTDITDRTYYIAHNHFNPTLMDLKIGETIKIGNQKLVVESKVVKDNSTSEAYDYVINNWDDYQLQTCLDDKYVIIYNLNLES